VPIYAFRKERSLAYGLPNISFVGYPVPLPCAGHAGLGFREVGPAAAPAISQHFRELDAADRRMRFCATLNDEALDRHVDGMWSQTGLVLAAHDGPLWSGPLRRAGPIRALAELSIAEGEAELGISVESVLRRRGVATYLVQTAARLLAPRGVRSIRASTLPDNASFLALARKCDAVVEIGRDEVEVTFDVATLHEAYLRRRATQVFLPAQ
jgi:GNAT superfamily N-acetyltransferase